ncbi:EAL domain-containing protein [Rhodoferax sp.]|uniref:EAL domain-containing protein n=1 Tax=Rhodoferax sp. TaxID=50421 RepID=UPI00276C3444|nr:EAL domain-containing protein [Rhodoferax sp.]
MKSKNSSHNVIEILIAEDSPTQAEQLQYLLEGHDYKVVPAANGRKALESLRRRRPSLVISDIVMPEMNGYELCKAIKSDQALKDIPVILVTTLSDVLDIMKGLECGADNFIRKPYDEKYLLARVDYLLMNQEMRKSQKMQMGMEIHLGGERHFITAERQQIVDLLISVYEEAIHLNEELKVRQRELADSNRALTGLYHVAEGLNHAVSEREVCERALEHVVEIPGVRAGWISLREGETGFRLAAARNLPPALQAPGAMEGLCECRRRLLAGELDHVTNILKCERLGKAKDDAQGLQYHASVPLWNGDQTLGVMNLVGTELGLFREDELKTLYGVGHQVGIALERARLHEHLEKLVAERTVALTAEIAERKRIQEGQARLVAIIEATPDLVATASPDGRILYMNQAGIQMLGFEKIDDFSTQRINDRHPEWAGKLVLEEGIPHAISHGTWSAETAFLRRDGREVPVLQVIIAHKNPDGSVQYLSTIARDITQRKTSEARIARLNRIYSVLSGINTTIVRVREETELFSEACRIAVEHGRFTFAWLGKLDADTQQVTPVARAGREDGYLAQINLSACEEVPGSCALTARALTEAKPMICNDIASDERMVAWRSEALSRGYRSVAVLPLTLERKPVGVFVLYAAETSVFDDEEMKLLVEMAGDISFAMDNLKKEEKLNYLAYYDAITGLPNRALFYDRLGQHLHDAQSSAMVAVLAIDLERFRVINETFGRHLGDALLKQIAERLIGTGVGVDHLARISADCFAVALPNIREEADIVRFLEGQITAALSKSFKLEGDELRISAKAGIALFPGDGKDADTLFRNAEAALKKTKLSGDKYLFYSPEFNARVAEKLMLENKLRKALEQGQFLLHYQPKVDLKSNQIIGLEALMRWNDPETGLVPPGKFIPVLEETGMITEAGAWALTQAMADYRELQKNNLSPPRIAVNVSQVQLQRNDFVSTIERVVSGSGGVLPGGLEIEITESLIMQNIEANIQKLHAIREMGVEVAIDDFGTGYSSLSYIAKLPINSLKIDRAFIINMTSNADDLSIVSAIISLAHSLNLRVVAEGVETNEQAKLLRLLKCDEIQGFLFSPGVPIGQIGGFLKEKKSLPM